MDELQRAVENLDPKEALSALAMAAKSLLANLGEEEHLHFLMDLLGEERGDNLTSMVHL